MTSKRERLMHYNLKERQRANIWVLKYAYRPSIFRFCCSLLASSHRERERNSRRNRKIPVVSRFNISATNVVDMENLRLIMNFNEDAARGFI